jgi:hypothetical protein
VCENRENKPHPPDSLVTDELPEQTSKKAQVRLRKSPVPRPPDHQIHERAQIPPVPEGENVPDETPSPPVDLD